MNRLAQTVGGRVADSVITAGLGAFMLRPGTQPGTSSSRSGFLSPRLGSSWKLVAFSPSGLPRAIARQSRYSCVIPALNLARAAEYAKAHEVKEPKASRGKQEGEMI